MRYERDSRRLIRLLKRDGWEPVSVKGSPHHFKHPGKPGKVTVAHPDDDIPIRTLKSIYAQAGLTPNEKK